MPSMGDLSCGSFPSSSSFLGQEWRFVGCANDYGSIQDRVGR
jgi:hypothetical protein